MRLSCCRPIALLALSACIATAAAQVRPGAGERPPPGHTRALSLPRAVKAPVIDGVLDDAAWQSAAKADRFWDSLQDRWPEEQTEVLVTADRTHLYFGFKVYDRHPEAIEALQTRRDGDLGVDDQVGVELDPYLTYRQISTYRVNAIGTQRDDLGGGRAAQEAWKGNWKAAVARTSYGWSAEIAIPYEILNFTPGTRTIGVNFVRYHHRTAETSTWADITMRSLPEEMGQLRDLRPILVGKEDPWTFLPYVVAGRHVPDRGGVMRDRVLDGGIAVRYEPRPNLTGVLSLRPDFTQVERAVTDIDFSYNEKYRPDLRPFFQEGSAYFGDDNTYFYSNRIPAFDAGLKAFGRVGRDQFGALAVRAPDQRTDLVANVDHQFDPTHYAAAMLVATDRQDLRNVLYAARARGRESSGLFYGADAAGTSTPSAGVDGTYAHGSLGWAHNYWSTGITADRYSRDFSPADGLLARDLPDTSGGTAYVSYTRERAAGLLREVRGDLSFEQRDTGDGQLQRRRVYASGSIELRQQEIRLGSSYFAGPYRRTMESPGTWSAELNRDHYWNGAVDFNTRSSRLGYGFAHSEGFLGGDSYRYSTGYLWSRPTSTTYVSLTAEHLQNFGSYRQSIVSGGWDVTPAHAIAFRVIDAYYGEAYRVAYTFHARTNLDLFMVWDSFPGEDDQLSLKLLMTL